MLEVVLRKFSSFKKRLLESDLTLFSVTADLLASVWKFYLVSSNLSSSLSSSIIEKLTGSSPRTTSDSRYFSEERSICYCAWSTIKLDPLRYSKSILSNLLRKIERTKVLASNVLVKYSNSFVRILFNLMILFCTSVLLLPSFPYDQNWRNSKLCNATV